MKITKLNWTQIPNSILDKMGDLTDAELRVLLAICRKTIGYHKDTDVISHSQLVEMTGLSVHGLKTARESLVEKNLIRYSVQGKGKSTKTVYDLFISQGDTIENQQDFNISHGDIKNQPNISREDTKAAFNISHGDTTKESLLNKNSETNFKAKKPTAVSNDTELFHAIKDSFEAKGEITDYPKEMKHVKLLCKKLEKKPMEYAQAVIETFYKLVETGNDFWKSQPFLPSVLNSLFDRVNLQVKKKEKVNDVSWYEEYTKEVI
jgi:phage replication O-like protein O